MKICDLMLVNTIPHARRWRVCGFDGFHGPWKIYWFMMVWSLDLFIYWSTDPLIYDLWIYWSIDLLNYWFIDIDLLMSGYTDVLIYGSIDLLIYWSRYIDQLIYCSIDPLRYWSIDLKSIDLLIYWFIDLLICGYMNNKTKWNFDMQKDAPRAVQYARR